MRAPAKKLAYNMNCLFCKIAQAELPAKVLFEDDTIMAFHDLHPQAPTHVLIIPKQHLSTLNDCDEKDVELLGNMMLRAKKIAQTEGFSDNGYRLVLNINAGGGQEIYHIHLHLLGGRQMTWPPG